MLITPSINGTRLLGRLDAFAAIGATADGGVDRQALTEGDRRARAAITEIALARGFAVSQDAAANLFIHRPGGHAGTLPLLIGSHLDTQPTGGRFDGALGVLAALEVLESLEDADIQTAAPIELVVWTNEEGCRFAPGSMGAQAFVDGALSDTLLESRSTDGLRLADELAATLKALPQARPCTLGKPIAGYLELHIEQAQNLERAGIPIGVVTGVQATRWLQVSVTGEAGHAGTTPLSARRDPMHATSMGLARLYETIMRHDTHARFTVGRMTVEPGSINAIPSTVIFYVDIRHPGRKELDAIEAQITGALHDAATGTGCTVAFERVFDMEPARFDDTLINAIEDVAKARGVASTRMVSGAFHDALFVSRVAPTAMIFVPCRDGISHNPREFVEPEFCIMGADILFHAALRASEMTVSVAEPGIKTTAISNNHKGVGT
ncbi:Zn-dependent hydrolase [Shinella oryzae]|uniref:Zn-dependent hydrolase n=1 Tax=Shinella oryzae TaxID=2871820 RepID=UPI001FF5D67C|nr:Zn-dependent hydrolase [Shinella oryzae]UPA27584.1 Zn-dependent hydrolase [Shinella oryzae]